MCILCLTALLLLKAHFSYIKLVILRIITLYFIISYIENVDYQSVTDQLTYNMDSGSTLCFNFLIFSNDGVEDTENFIVNANSNDSLVSSSIRIQRATVNIINGDGKLIKCKAYFI